MNARAGLIRGQIGTDCGTPVTVGPENRQKQCGLCRDDAFAGDGTICYDGAFAGDGTICYDDAFAGDGTMGTDQYDVTMHFAGDVQFG